MVIITPISDKKKSTVPEPDTVLFGGDYRDRTGDHLKPLFFLCKGSVMLRQMESVLCGRFAVTNKIADNLPF